MYDWRGCVIARATMPVNGRIAIYLPAVFVQLSSMDFVRKVRSALSVSFSALASALEARRRRRILSPRMAGALALAVLAASGCQHGKSAGTAVAELPAGKPAYVDYGKSEQTIRGFGGTSAWVSDFSSSQADTLFGTGSGEMGLSILRVRIDPGGADDWDTELNNAQQAETRGATVIATAWSPPAFMKDNDRVMGGSLAPDSYTAYAAYLESFVKYMASVGVNLYGVSLQNEPDTANPDESCIWTPEQMDRWIADNAETLSTRLIVPESRNFSASYADQILNDPKAAAHVAIIAGHLYGVAPTPYPAAVKAGKEVWMTEHYLPGTGISGALALAKEIHDSLTQADYSAYLWRWIENYPAGRYSSGLMDGTGNITLNGYAMGQFSRFVRPGYVRSPATANPNPGVYVSAYKGSGHWVIVAINLGSSAVRQPFVIQHAAIKSMTPFETTVNETIAGLSTMGVANDSFSYVLPAKSIVTFVN